MATASRAQVASGAREQPQYFTDRSRAEEDCMHVNLFNFSFVSCFSFVV